MSTEEERRLADFLKHAVPQPPRDLTDEEITVVQLPRKSWLMPALAAAAVVIIGGGAGAYAATRTPGPATPSTASASTAAGSAAPASTPAPSASCPTATPAKVVVVPNLVGVPQNQAHFTAAADGLAVAAEYVAPPDGHPVPAGTVWRQTPAGDSRVAVGTVVTLFVAPGSTASTAPATPATSPSPVAPASCAPVAATPAAPTATPASAATTTPPAAPGQAIAIPSVVGMTAAGAQSLLQADGLTVALLTQVPPAGQHVPAGVVWGQSPVTGSVAPGTTITIYVAPAPAR